MMDQSHATHALPRHTAAHLLPLLLLLIGCDRMLAVDPTCRLEAAASVGDCAPPLSGETFTIVFTPELGTAGLLFNASGAIEDAGRAEGNLLRVDLTDSHPDTWSGGRGLRGAKGVIAIVFDGKMTEADPPAWSGRFTILRRGTGAYVDLQAEGTFSVRLDEEGRAVETFSGRVGS